MNDAEKARIVELRERGLTYAQIGRDLDRHPGSVCWQCLIMGVEPPEPPRLAEVPREPVIVLRGDHSVRRFTVDEDSRLLELERQGFNYAEIARRLGRRRNSVLGRLATLARRDALLEESA